MSAGGVRLAAVMWVTAVLAGARAEAVRPESGTSAPVPPGVKVKPLDEPNQADRERIFRRRQLLARSQRAAGSGPQVRALELEAGALATAGSDRILVILVEFAGTDTFTWTKGSSTWDPLGKTSTAEVVRDGSGNLVAGDCSLILSETQSFTYSGPLHNRIERPRSETDRSGTSIWTPDFSPAFFNDLILGNGVVFDYDRQDGSAMYRSFLGRSVRDFYEDMSGGRYTLSGTVVGWVQVPHSVWWYGADQCPGARSADTTAVWTSGAIPGAGSAKTLVVDALDAVKAAYPAFDWASYDVNKDGVIDRLWVIHAGYGEEDSPELLDRTDYGEAQIWSHSSSLAPQYEVVPGVRAGAYIVMPENSGMGVLAHEFGHNIGADDLYAYGAGDTSAGFWTIMADDWTGYPIGFEPPAFDPWHLDGWGWLDPKVIVDPTQTYTVKVGQASEFAGGADVYRGVKIVLPDQQVPLAVAPRGTAQWWSGAENLITSTMTLRTPIAVPAGGATLSFALAYRTEDQWDWLWVQASDDGGATWRTLTNAHTRCNHHPQWIGGQYGFPDDLCAAGIGGFTGASPGFPAYGTESFSLSAFAGKSILIRLWYMTDWGTLDAGAFVDDVVVPGTFGSLLSDNAETEKHLWTFAGTFARVGSGRSVPHAYYLQWRNVGATGGYDGALGDPLWRYGPSNTGLLVWYNNDRYTDNEVANYLNEPPGFGPKGRVLVVDAHPEPYRWPPSVAAGWVNEAGNAVHRQQMRDAPFSLRDTVPFTLFGESFASRPGVGVFDDSLGYYPGAEYVLRGPGYAPPQSVWMTKQWDASAVVPALTRYGIAAPGLGAGDPLRYRCSQSGSGLTSCYWFSGGLGYAGGTGNPGDAGSAYGWKVEILAESDAQATLRISNSGSACALACSATAPGFARVGAAATFAVAENLTGCTGEIARSWEFGDDTPGATSASVSHTYARSGSFRWQVAVAAAGQLCTRSGTVVVGNGPDARVAQGAVEIADGATAPVSFGTVPQGVRGPTLVFTVTNGGDLPLELGPVTAPAGFTLVEPLAATLAPRGEDTFSLRMESASAGARAGKVGFATNEAGAEEFDFQVAGTVAPPLSRFDFGTGASALQKDYLRVAAGTRYAAATGFGWQSGSIGERDRAAGSALRKDLNFTPLGVFAVDLPNGPYVALVTMGDTSGLHDQMAVSLEGTQVDTVGTAVGEVAPRAYRAFVADGQLNLQLQDLGGKDANAVINALEIVPVAARRFDFGTVTSPLAPGCARVAPTTRHASSLGYGWSSGTIDARDRGTGTPLARDFDFTPLGTFVVDVPNATYDVAVTLGDASGAHDQMGVFLEGAQVDSITTAPRELLTRVYRVAVADGKLTVLLDDLGGTDPNVVINGLEVTVAHDGRFDFGTAASPVESRYARVAHTARYATAGGFGWLPAAVEGRDRGAGTSLDRDFNFTPLGVFLADLPPGDWDAAVMMGDATGAHDQMALLLEGVKVATVTKAVNQFHTASYRITTADDLLSVGLEDLGGTDPNAVVNALTLLRVRANAFDFGTATSPVETGCARVTNTTAYAPGIGYGWLSGRVEARDRATGTALRRDINATAEATFVVDVPNGTWDVTVTLGDATAAHDAMGVFLEGARADTVSTARGQFCARTYRVVVADGQLTVLLDDLGGADPNVTIAGLELR